MFKSKRAIYPALIGVGVLVFAGCGDDDESSSSSAAATVNGTDISVERVETQRDVIAENPQTKQQMEGQDETQVDEQLKADALSQLIFEIILQDGAEEMEVEVSDEDIQKTLDEIAAQYGGEDALYTELEKQGLDREEVDRQLEFATLQDAVIAELGPGVSDEDIQKAYDEGTPARHILVEKKKQANKVVDRIEGGEEFADVAKDMSTDGSAQQGGDLGFIQPGMTVPAFEDALFKAKEGELVGPVKSDFGFHVIERLEKPPLEDVKEDLRSSLEQSKAQEGQAAFQQFLTEQMKAAEVEVDETFGKWDGEQGKVVPENPIQPEQPGQQPPPEEDGEPNDGGGDQGNGEGDGGAEGEGDQGAESGGESGDQ